MSERNMASSGFGVAFVAAFILSTTGIFIRYLTVHYPIQALPLAFWRAGFVVVTLLPFLLAFRSGELRIRKEHVLFFAGFGLVLALFNTIWTIAVAMTGASVATVLVNSSAAFTALFGFVFLKERADFVTLVIITICLLGCALVADSFNLDMWTGSPLGIVAGLLSGILYALYSIFGRQASRADHNHWTSLFYTFLFGTAFLGLFNLACYGFPGTAAALFSLGGAMDGWGILFALSAFPTVVGFGLYNLSLKLLPAGIANLIVSSEPVFTVAIAFLVLGEVMNVREILGSVMLLSGICVLRLLMWRKEQPRGWLMQRKLGSS